MWLLAKGKHSKAHRNLSRLRGKVSYEKCETEFQEMVKYSSPSNNDEPSNITNFPLVYFALFYCTASSTCHNFIDQKENTNAWKQLFEPEVMRAFRLMTIYFFFMNLLSGLPLLPYLVSILKEFGAPVNIEWTIVSYLAK